MKRIRTGDDVLVLAGKTKVSAARCNGLSVMIEWSLMESTSFVVTSSLIRCVERKAALLTKSGQSICQTLRCTTRTRTRPTKWAFAN